MSPVARFNWITPHFIIIHERQRKVLGKASMVNRNSTTFSIKVRQTSFARVSGSSNNGEECTRVDKVHLPGLICHISFVILDDTERVNPEVAFAQLSCQAYSILYCARQAGMLKAARFTHRLYRGFSDAV